MPLEKQILTWPLTGGLSTKDAPFMQVPGSHLTIDNLRQERTHEWRLRPAMPSVSTDNLPSSNPPLLASELPGGGLVALTHETGFNSAARIYSPTLPTRWTTPSNLVAAQSTPSAWARKTVAAVPGRVAKTSTAAGGGYRITAWNTGVGTGPLTVALTSTADGSDVTTPTVRTYGTLTAYPCCVYVPAVNRLCVFYVEMGATDRVVLLAWDTTTGSQTTGGTTIDATATENAFPYLDAISYAGDTSNATVVFRTSANQIRFVRYQPSSLTATTAVTVAVACDNCLSLCDDPDGSGIVPVGVSDATDTRVVRLNTAGAVQTNDVAVAGAVATHIAGVAYQTGAGWYIVIKDSAATPNITAAKKRSAAINTLHLYGGGDTGTSQDLTIDSAAWREAGTDLMRFVLGRHITTDTQNGGAKDDQHSYYERALQYDTGAAVTDQFQDMQARILPLEAIDVAPFTASLGQVQRVGTEQFTLALPRRARIGIQADNSNAPATSYAVDSWTVTYRTAANLYSLNVGRPTKTSQATYIPAGQLLQCNTGASIVGQGSCGLPRIPSLQQGITGGGGLVTGQTYQYLSTIEIPDDLGNIWRSGPGVANSIAITGANNRVTVTLSAPQNENTGRIRTVKIWRTKGNGSVYQLLYSKTDTVANTLLITYIDVIADGTLASADFLPGDALTAPTTVTPAFSHVAAFGDRLWGVQRDFPDRLLFSKKITPGLSPEFVDTFLLVISDAHGDFTGLVALDDKLLAFKQDAIYAIAGDGPDSGGAGAFPAWNRVAGDLGAIVGSPFASAGPEVFFVGRTGIYRINKGLETDFVGLPVDKFFNQDLIQTPEVARDMVLSQDKNEMRVQTANYRLVFDRLRSVWIRDTGLASCQVTTTIADTQYLFMDSGQTWIENVDGTLATDGQSGTAYQGILRSAWIRTQMEGWFRLYRARALGLRTASGGNSDTLILKIYYDQNDSISYSATSPSLSTSGVVRAEARPSRSKCSAFSFELTWTATNSNKVRLEAWSAQVGVKRGVQPLTANERWQ